MEEISLRTLLEAGCHFGHKSDRWHPKAASFIYQERDGIHVIDLAKTKAGLNRAAVYAKDLGKSGRKLLFVGTKRQAATIVKEEAETASSPYITKRWIGGFLTNWEQVHKNLEKIRRLTDEEKNNAWLKYPKHERVKLARYLRKLNYFYGGVSQLISPPDAVFVVDIRREKVGVDEARKMGTPVIAVVDTNTDPTEIDYVVPANDDAVGSIKFIVHYIAAAYKEGWDEYEKDLQKKAKEESEPPKQVANSQKTAAPAEKAAAEEIAEPAPMTEPKKEVKKKTRKSKTPPPEIAAETPVGDEPPVLTKKRGRPKKTA